LDWEWEEDDCRKICSYPIFFPGTGKKNLFSFPFFLFLRKGQFGMKDKKGYRGAALLLVAGLVSIAVVISAICLARSPKV
jgi:hypothetical protein